MTFDVAYPPPPLLHTHSLSSYSTLYGLRGIKAQMTKKNALSSDVLKPIKLKKLYELFKIIIYTYLNCCKIEMTSS